MFYVANTAVNINDITATYGNNAQCCDQQQCLYNYTVSQKSSHLLTACNFVK